MPWSDEIRLIIEKPYDPARGQVSYPQVLNEERMKLNIRERCQKIFQSFSAKGHPTIRAIAEATGIYKSSVHRHQQAMKRRH